MLHKFQNFLCGDCFDVLEARWRAVGIEWKVIMWEHCVVDTLPE
jgi:hypothetical protein